MQDVDCPVKTGATGNQWPMLDLPEQPNGGQREDSTKSDHSGGEAGGLGDGLLEDVAKMDGKTKQLPTTDDSYLASTVKSFNKLSVGQSSPQEQNAAAINSFLALAGGVAWHQGPAPPGDAEFPFSALPGFSMSGAAGYTDPSQGRYHPQWQSPGPQVAGYVPRVQYTNPRRTFTHGWGNEGMSPRLGWGPVNARNGINPSTRAANGQVERCLPGNQLGYALQGHRVANYAGFNTKSGQDRVFTPQEGDQAAEDLKTMIRLSQEECRFHGYEMPKVNMGLEAQLLNLLRSQQEVPRGSNSWTSSTQPHRGKPFVFSDTRTGHNPSVEGTQLLNKAVIGHLVASSEKATVASLGLQRAHDRGECYSRKVFVGGLPPDIDEDEILAAFRRFGPLAVDWPHKAESKSYFPPKGYCFLLFQDELSVQSLVDFCIVEDGKLFWYVSSPTTKDKPVQIRPWNLADSDLVMDNSQPIDPRKTVFVGGVPRPLKAVELAMIMGRLYGGVCYAGIDTDPELKYPKGAGRVAFSNQQSYIAAISARFVQLQHGDVDKRVEVKPYVLDDQICDECQGLHSGGKFAPFFCSNVLCLQYYCERCWAVIHSSPGREFHKPLVKEGTDRPRPMPFHWS